MVGNTFEYFLSASLSLTKRRDDIVVADMVADMAADMKVHMVADMEVDKVADVVADEKEEKLGHACMHGGHCLFLDRSQEI